MALGQRNSITLDCHWKLKYFNVFDDCKTLEDIQKKLDEKVKKAIDTSIQTTDESIDLQKFKRIHNILDDNRKQNFAVEYPDWSHLYA